METLLMMLFVGALAKGTTKAVLGGGKRRKKRTNWDHLSYGQKAWLHDHSKCQVLSKNGNE